jgi:hypothetical protein
MNERGTLEYLDFDKGDLLSSLDSLHDGRSGGLGGGADQHPAHSPHRAGLPLQHCIIQG